VEGEKEAEKMAETLKIAEIRARVRCNSCFKFSWVTVAAGYNVNRIICGRCQKPNAVVCKFITIRPEHEGRACDARCQSSKSGNCECSCGGKNHGMTA
jgi:hypothetical protein